MKSVGSSVNQDVRPTVFVVDDDASVREAVRSLLRSVGLSVETFGTAQEFLSSPRNTAPGCLVLDVRLPGIGGLELQHQLAEGNLHVPIVFITGHGDIPMSVRAIKAGAVEFLTKPFRDQDLLDAVQQAIDQDRRARQQRAEIAALRQCYDALSPRERQVVALVVRGLRRSPARSAPAKPPSSCTGAGPCRKCGRPRWRTSSAEPRSWAFRPTHSTRIPFFHAARRTRTIPKYSGATPKHSGVMRKQDSNRITLHTNLELRT
jgi:FixJ family two-component response regulator